MRWEHHRTDDPSTLNTATQISPATTIMVKKGRFTVELVSADAKVAFMEHTKDGKTYAEVEPEVEYFVRIEVEPSPRVL